MEHISGNVSNTIGQDFGEFVTILNMRIRKELIVAYFLGGPIKSEDAEANGKYSVNVMVQHGWNSTSPHSKEECEKQIEQLDWIYKKDSK